MVFMLQVQLCNVILKENLIMSYDKSFLMYTAIRDQDLYYLKAPPRLHQQRNPQPDSTLIMGLYIFDLVITTFIR